MSGRSIYLVDVTYLNENKKKIHFQYIENYLDIYHFLHNLLKKNKNKINKKLNFKEKITFIVNNIVFHVL